MRDALQSYRCQHSELEDDGGGLPLVDLFTPPGDKTIERGREEMDLLEDHIASELIEHSRPSPSLSVERLAAAMEIADEHGDLTDRYVGQDWAGAAELLMPFLAAYAEQPKEAR